MNDKPKYNPDIHHRRSIRLKGYDYSQAGLYFITICCQDRIWRFGEIVAVENSQAKMILNDAGIIANECWLEIPEHFPNAKLHEHIVMPNHVHGIIELSGYDERAQDIEPVPPNIDSSFPKNAKVQNIEPQHKFQKIIPGSIGSIIRGYKIGVTLGVKNIFSGEKLWQRNFYEHIIRNEKAYQTISNYIVNNPIKWNADKFYRTK
ncbi:MAG: hypothetical protein ABI784_05120 [Ginsengibacter sp.]